MAHRDTSQGFGFLYVDVEQIFRNLRLQKIEAQENNNNNNHDNNNAKVSSRAENAAAKNEDQSLFHIPKDKNQKSSMSTAVPGNSSTRAVSEIRSNLDRLQSLHHQLHAMLEELDQVTKKPK